MGDSSQRDFSGGGGRGTPGHHTALLTQSDHDIIRSFLSTPAGFPLSPGAALAELTGLAPLSPGLASSQYHFAMSPRHQDPPSPSRYLHSDRPSGYTRPCLNLHSPRTHSPPRAVMDSPHRGTSTCNSPRRFLGSPLRVTPRTYSPELVHRSNSPINLHNFHRDAFGSPGRPDAWSPPPYEHDIVHSSQTQQFLTHSHDPSPRHRNTARSPIHRRQRTESSSPPPPPPRQSLEYAISPHHHLDSSPRHHFAQPPKAHSPNSRVLGSPRAPVSPRPQRYFNNKNFDLHHYSTLTPRPMSPAPSCHISAELPRVPIPLEQLQQYHSEPLDLETSHYDDTMAKQDSIVQHPTQSPTRSHIGEKPLTKLVSAKIATEKRKRRQYRKPTKGHKRRQERRSSFKHTEQTNTVSEVGATDVEKRLHAGCQCGTGCLSGFESKAVLNHRRNISKLSRTEHDMYLMGIIMATLIDPKATSKQKQRQRNRNKYIFQGQEVCMNAFLYLENVTAYHIKAIRSHVLDVGVMPRRHEKDQPLKNYASQEEHCNLAVIYLNDLLSKSDKNRDYKYLHNQYVGHFKESRWLMTYKTFRSWAAKMLPELVDNINASISLPKNQENDTILKLNMNSFSADC